MKYSSILALAGAVTAAPWSSPPTLPVKLETRHAVTSRLSNIHVTFDLETVPSAGGVSVTYGACDSPSIHDAHHTIGVADRSSRLVWIVPEDGESMGCLSAWDADGMLLGRSEPQELQHRYRRRAAKRDSIAMDASSGIDNLGPWFNGVELLQNTQPPAVDVAKAKAKNIAIVGAGMSGLMTYLVLHQAGFTNITILEAGSRLGGRVRTEYLSGGPSGNSYQEMGPMRFPEKVTFGGQTFDINDHQLVFQLAAELNSLNGGNPNYNISFIPWIQDSPNGLVYNNGFKLDTGLPPTVAQIAANASLGGTVAEMPVSAQILSGTVLSTLTGGGAFLVELAQNMFQAHKDWIENGLQGIGGDSWSEWAYMVNYLNATKTDADLVGTTVIGADRGASWWSLLYDIVYFSAGTWRTIDGGLNRLPLAFQPLVNSITTLGRRIERVNSVVDPATGGKKVQLQWRDGTKPKGNASTAAPKFASASYDYVFMSAPFNIVKTMRLPSLPPLITNAINNMPYTSACKVALEFKTRFWEHLANPIFGGCSTTTDIPGVGNICYPSYNLNGTGPASILASYIFTNDWGHIWASRTEAEHVSYILDAMAEIHGDALVRGQYTGKFNRRCWAEDPLATASWAEPDIGMHSLYIPEYFKTYDGLVFIGEHTSYTHAWISSALESGIRGSVQVMLELGLVDEAKDAVQKWMARWIDV